MKFSKKIILISILTLMILPFFLISRTTIAQEYTYNGADTEKIPGFSVYPTECYIANVTFAPENYTILEIIKGNITDTWMGLNFGENGTCIYVTVWMVNSTSGEKSIALNQDPEDQFAWWNPAVNYTSMACTIIPVESDGKVSAEILNNVTLAMEIGYFQRFGVTFENKQIFPNIYSYLYWNSSHNNVYFYQNFTADGINTETHHNVSSLQFPIVTLMSQPEQLPPDFTFTTETGSLTLDSTDFKLNISIMDADNNNDGETDTDYLYRIQNGTTWSDWAIVNHLLQIAWDLGDVAAGNYDITIEVKNMYGVTQKDITIQYSPPEDGDGDGDEIIPGYPIILISFAAIFSISIIILRYRKKLRL